MLAEPDSGFFEGMFQSADFKAANVSVSRQAPISICFGSKNSFRLTAVKFHVKIGVSLN